MNSVEIGKVVEIKNTSVLINIFESIETSFKIKNGQIIRIGGINNFIKIGTLIYQIQSERIENQNSTNSTNNKIIPTRTLICELIGYFEANGDYKIGANGEVPYLFQTVETLNHEELIKIYSNSKNICDAIKIGNYVFEKELDAYLDINKFFASHILLVGNTGSGKSNTLASLYTKLFQKKEYSFDKSKFLIIDTNGEYSKSFSFNKNIRRLNLRGANTNELLLPINLIKLEDWQILTSAAEKTQYPMLKTIVEEVDYNIFTKKMDITSFMHHFVKDIINDILTNNQRGSQKLYALLAIKDVINNYDRYNCDSNACNNFKDYSDIILSIRSNNDRLYIEQGNAFEEMTKEIAERITSLEIGSFKIEQYGIDEFIFLLELEQIKRVNSYGMNDSHLSPFVSRVKGLAQKLKKIFISYKSNNQNNTDLEEILFSKDKSICVCDVSNAGKDIRRTMVSFVLDKLYRLALEKRDNSCKGSFHFIIDEAHNYLSPSIDDKKDLVYESCLETIETIIKEGRKFGVFLTIATQRPSDITSTVLSQCHNYIIHKLVNPKDISIIENSIPFLDEMGIKMLTVLSPGQAIFSGTALNKANLISVDFPDKDYPVNSETPVLTSFWTKKKSEKDN